MLLLNLFDHFDPNSTCFSSQNGYVFFNLVVLASIVKISKKKFQRDPQFFEIGVVCCVLDKFCGFYVPLGAMVYNSPAYSRK